MRYVLILIILFIIVLLILFSVTNTFNQDQPILVESEFIENTQDSTTKPVIHKLFNLDLHYILENRKLCENDLSITALIIVTSYFGNVETRSAMRRAHSREDLKDMNMRRIFLLGESPEDKYTSQKSVEDEFRRFGDIVQGSFIEAYRNLTYKHAMGLKWATENCPNAKFVIKMDDDTVVNVDALPTVLQSFKISENKDFIAGYILRGMVPIREPANKWYVTHEEYEATNYPTFVSGWFYITTPKTCDRLFMLTHRTKYFWIDDTYITGILAQKLRIKHFSINKYFTVHSEYLDCCINDVRTKNLDCDILVGPNGGNNNLFYEFNAAMNICNLKLCEQRQIPLNETCVAEKKINLGKGDPIIEKYRLR